jgi:hypothetical protein
MPGMQKQFFTAGLRFNEPLAPKPNAYRICMVVCDDPSEALSSRDIPLHRVVAPNLNRTNPKARRTMLQTIAR